MKTSTVYWAKHGKRLPDWSKDARRSGSQGGCSAVTIAGVTGDCSLKAQIDLLTGMVMPELQDQVMQWKRRASKVVVVDAKLAKYDTLFKEHTLLKLEVVAW
ncbi:unnamed protein product [Sphagnum balticum]